MTMEVTKISVRAYADTLKISDKTVRNAIGDGKIKKGVAYKIQFRNGKQVEVPEIIKEIADKEWGFIYQTDQVRPGQNSVKVIEQAPAKHADQPKSNEAAGSELPGDGEFHDEIDSELISTLSITKNMSFREATRRREVIAAALDKLKLQELEGTLVRKSEVEKSLFAFGDEMKKELLNIPARCVDGIMASTNKVDAINILTIEIENALNKMVSGVI